MSARLAGQGVHRVMDPEVPGPIGVKDPRPSLSPASAGVTLIELLCVMSIVIILASLLFPAVTRAYLRVRGFAEEFEGEEIAEILLRQSRNYCTANPQFQFTSKTDYADKCHFWPKCRTWIEATATEFDPFSYLTPTNQVVLQVHIGPRHRTLYSYTRGDLSIRPPER